jgi:general secretion pathway protein K
MNRCLKAVGVAGRERGFALLIVLWTLILLSLVVTQMVAAARTETQIAFNLRSNIVEEANLDGVVYAAAFHLLDRSDQHWNADGSLREMLTPGGAVSVRVTDEANKMNLNTASGDLLRAALLSIGADTTTASGLAAAIVAWREQDDSMPTFIKVQQYRSGGRDYAPPEKPFRSVDELAEVLGMTPRLVARFKPHLTIYSSYGPSDASRDPVARAAILLLRRQGGILPFVQDGSGESVVQVTATASALGKAPLTRHAILRLDPSAKDRPFAILTWSR